MAFKNLTNEQAAQLAQTLGLEFTANAEKDLLNFADVLVGFIQKKNEAYAPAKAQVVEAPKAKPATPAKSKE